MKILSLDASTKRTGWAIIENDKLEYGAISSSSVDVEKRIGIMRDGVLDLIKKYNPDVIVMEEVRPDNSNARTGKVLTWLQGCIVVAVYEYNKNTPVEFIGATSWRSELGLQGYQVKREQQKQIDIAWANKQYNLELNSAQDDEANAIGILAARLKKKDEPIKKVKLEPIGSGPSAF